MYAKRPRPPVRTLVAVVVCVLALGVVVATSAPWSHPQSAAAAADALANTAAEQKTLTIGPDDWITTRFTTKRSWTQNLTQAKLDRLSVQAAAETAAANSSGHYERAGGEPISAAEQAQIDRINARRIARLRAGVRIGSLPTTKITAWNISSYESTRAANGYGGGGGGNNAVEYGSAAEKQAGKILQRAGIGGLHADPVDYGGSEIADLPTRTVSDEADVEKLAATPTKMRAELATWKQSGSRLGDAKQGSPLDIFLKATGVVGSPYASSAQRAAAIRLIAELPGVTLSTDARDARGRAGLGMAIKIEGGTMQIVFDRSDSRLLGMQVTITDPEAFVGDSYAGSGKDRVRVIPPFDSATIGVSYEPVSVSHDGPPCGPTMCMARPGESLQSFQERRKAHMKTR